MTRFRSLVTKAWRSALLQAHFCISFLPNTVTTMKNNLLFALLLCSSFPLFSQSIFENPEISYEISMEEFWSLADNDNASPDDLVLKWNLSTSPGNNSFTRCETWEGAAPCSFLVDPFDPAYHFNVDNADVSEYIFINYEGWEDDGGDLCTYDPGDDFYIALNPTLRNNGFVAGLGETQSRWEYNNSGPFGTEFLYAQSVVFDLRYRIAWRHVHGESIDDPLRFGFLSQGNTVATGGTNRFDLEEATNPNLSWNNDGGQNTADTYYQFSLNHHSKVKISTDNGKRTFDTYLTLYDAAHNVIVTDDDSGLLGDGYAAVIERVLAPGTYYINAEGSDLATPEEQKHGEYELSITVETPNNDPCLAIAIPANDVVQTGYSNVFANAVPGEGAIAPAPTNCVTSWCPAEEAPYVLHTIWFKFVAPANGAVEISTCGLADFDTQLALYDISDCGVFNAFTLLGANDDGTMFGVNCAGYTSNLKHQGLTPGKTYYIMVDGFDNAVGNLGIKITPILASAVQTLAATADVLTASPNPTQGLLNLKLQGQREMEAYSLIDLSGKIVQTEQFGEPTQETDLDLSALPNGVYLLQIHSGEQLFAQKVIVQR